MGSIVGRWGRRISAGALVIWLLLFVVGAEIALSAVRTIYSAQAVRTHRAKLATAPPEVEGPPFVAESLTWRYIELVTMQAGLRAGPEYEFDSFGLRVSRDGRVSFDNYRSLECRKIWFFGSSTVMGLGLPAKSTLPALLQDRLNAHGAGRYCVFNLGMGSQESTQEILLFYEMLAHGLRPDVVIFYDGLSEGVYSQPALGLANHPAWTGTGSRSAQIQAMNGSPSTQALAFIRSASAIVWLARMIRDTLRAQAPGLVAAADIDSQMDTMAERYALNVRVLRGIADSLGIPSFFFWQPALSFDVHYRFRSLTDREGEMWRVHGNPDEFRRHVAFSKVRQSRTFAQFPVINIADVFRGVDGPLYMDPRHPNSRGNALIAERLHAVLAERL